jgi:hypothetical protein
MNDPDIKADIKSDNGQITVEEAEALVQRERVERAGRALQEIGAVLAKHNCRLEAYVVLRGGQVIPQIEVRANE